MAIMGNHELSKNVLDKAHNFIVADTETRSSIYSGKNYSIGFLKTMVKKGLRLREGIRELEDRFMTEDEKDLLLIVIDSIDSGKPQVIKMQAPKRKLDSTGDLANV